MIVETRTQAPASPAEAPAPPRDATAPATTRARAVAPPDGTPAYYDVPMLQAPVWRWPIATYFFAGGLSAGAYLLARVGERVAGEEHRDLSRVGTWVACATFVPCAPLLVYDLGDPARFHHMLRVVKPSTPMNLGTWSITGYAGMAGVQLLRELVRDRAPALLAARVPAPVRTVALALHDAAGVPFALLVASYTGVLLSCTANPLWSRNPWIGPLFSASAVATGADAIALVLALGGRDRVLPVRRMLARTRTAAHAVEAASGAAFVRRAGAAARPMTRTWPFRVAVGALAGAEILERVAARDRAPRWTGAAASVLGLVSGFALRWAMVYGGRSAAADPKLARSASRARPAEGAPARRAAAAAARDWPLEGGPG